jgi:hypothetical protein
VIAAQAADSPSMLASRSPAVVHTYDDGVGNTRAEREEPLARTAYVAAARRFVTASASVLALGVPIDPGQPPRPVPAWTAEHVAALRELHAALGAMLTARRHWDALRREHGPQR